MIGPLRKDQERNSHRDQAAQRHFTRPRDRRLDRAFAELSGNQDDQHRGKWRDPEIRIECRNIRQRCNRKRHDEGLGQQRIVRNEHADDRAINRAADRADNVFERRAHRSAGAHLRHHDGGEDHPKPAATEYAACERRRMPSGRTPSCARRSASAVWRRAAKHRYGAERVGWSVVIRQVQVRRLNPREGRARKSVSAYSRQSCSTAALRRCGTLRACSR